MIKARCRVILVVLSQNRAVWRQSGAFSSFSAMMRMQRRVGRKLPKALTYAAGPCLLVCAALGSSEYRLNVAVASAFSALKRLHVVSSIGGMPLLRLNHAFRLDEIGTGREAQTCQACEQGRSMFSQQRSLVIFLPCLASEFATVILSRKHLGLTEGRNCSAAQLAERIVGECEFEVFLCLRLMRSVSQLGRHVLMFCVAEGPCADANASPHSAFAT